MLKTNAALVVFLVFALPIFSQGQDLSGGSPKETRKEYYPDGKLKSSCVYNKKGLLDGTCKKYSEEGRFADQWS